MKIAKTVVTFIMCIAIAVQINMQFLVVAGFYLNRDYIAANLCENKAHPEKKCCGKCYLNKQLSKSEKEQSKGGGADSKGKPVLLLFCESPKPFRLQTFTSLAIAVEYPSFNSNLRPAHLDRLLRPPCA